MATVGDILTAPEAGWKRYDDKDASVSYIGDGWSSDTRYTPYNGSRSLNSASTENTSIRFNFTGTRLRIICVTSTNWSDKLKISIDNVEETFSEYGPVVQGQVLNYEKTNLEDKAHSVIITNLGTIYWGLDAIDIDEKGEIKPYAPINAPTNLVATAGDSKVSLTWTAVSNATSYNVKRSTTAGGTYTTIASNVTDVSYVDTSVTNGTTYYYVVTAVNSAGESNTSNEASATPVDSRKSLLRITMHDSSEREYQCLQKEIDAFIAWCNRTVDTGTAYYVFDKIVGEQKSKEYLFFEKIISFEVLPIGK